MIQLDQDGLRVFEKANSGPVFESCQYLDVGAAPAIVIVASGPVMHYTRTTSAVL